MTLAECRMLPTADKCQLRSGCRWVSVTCDVGRVVAGCFPVSAGPQAMISCASDAGPGADADCPEGEDCEVPPSDTGHRAADAGGDVGDGNPWNQDGESGADASSSADATDASSSDASSSVCDAYDARASCESDGKCSWWTGTCDGYVVEEDCIEKGSPPPKLVCKSIAPQKCHEQTESTCYAPNCEWVEKGCGGGTGNSTQIEGCLPRNGCKQSGDCPSDHRCATLWLDPCHDAACTACGTASERCVPESLLSP